MEPERMFAILMLVVILLGSGLMAKTAKKNGWFGEMILITVFFVCMDVLVFFGL